MSEQEERLLDVLERMADSLDSLAGAFECMADFRDRRSSILLRKTAVDDGILVYRENAAATDAPSGTGLIQEGDIAEGAPRVSAELTAFLRRSGTALSEHRSGMGDPIQPSEADQELDNIAHFMGEHYEELRNLLSVVKSSLNNGPGFSFSFRCLNQNGWENDKCLIWSGMLYRLGFFEDMSVEHCDPGPGSYQSCVLTLSINPAGAVHNFLSGIWLERCTARILHDTVSAFLERHHMARNYEVYRNLELDLLNEQRREVDLILEIPSFNRLERSQGCFFWFECKSGDLDMAAVTKFRSLTQRCRVAPTHCFIVVASRYATAEDHNFSKQYGIRIFNLFNLSTELDRVLEAIVHVEAKSTVVVVKD